MQNSEAIEILNMFTKAVNLAKSRNRYEFNQEISKALELELLKKAYPYNANLINTLSLMRNIHKAF